MDSNIHQLLEQLADCTPRELRSWHASLSTAKLPTRTKSTVIRAQIIWMEQAKAEGLEMTAFQALILKQLLQRDKSQNTLTPGTRLLREWHGKTYTVDVLPNGYCYNDNCYDSLSEVARFITGTRWSGPRFFGIKGKTRD
jgi:hypothetical protein